jgi:hypothetical protein
MTERAYIWCNRRQQFICPEICIANCHRVKRCSTFKEKGGEMERKEVKKGYCVISINQPKTEKENKNDHRNEK